MLDYLTQDLQDTKYEPASRGFTVLGLTSCVVSMVSVVLLKTVGVNFDSQCVVQ